MFSDSECSKWTRDSHVSAQIPQTHISSTPTANTIQIKNPIHIHPIYIYKELGDTSHSVQKPAPHNANPAEIWIIRRDALPCNTRTSTLGRTALQVDQFGHAMMATYVDLVSVFVYKGLNNVRQLTSIQNKPALYTQRIV